MTQPIILVNGSSTHEAHVTTSGSSVSLALQSIVGVHTATYTVVGWSHSTLSTPTITNGTLIGTASFTFPSYSDDGEGRSLLIEVAVNGGYDTQGKQNPDLRNRVLIGVLNSNGIVPIASDEALERDAVVGWLDAINTGIAGTGGSVDLSGYVKRDGSTTLTDEWYLGAGEHITTDDAVDADQVPNLGQVQDLIDGVETSGMTLVTSSTMGAANPFTGSARRIWHSDGSTSGGTWSQLDGTDIDGAVVDGAIGIDKISTSGSSEGDVLKIVSGVLTYATDETGGGGTDNSNVVFHEHAVADFTDNINTTTPGTLYYGGSTLSSGRIFLREQTSPANNGLWVYTGPTNALTRPSDGDPSTMDDSVLHVVPILATHKAQLGNASDTFTTQGRLYVGRYFGSIWQWTDVGPSRSIVHPQCTLCSTQDVNISSPSYSNLDMGSFETLANLTRILLVKQTAPAENGPWLWHGAGEPLTRPYDYVEDGYIKASEETHIFPVMYGTLWGGTTFWYPTTSGLIDTDVIAWSHVGGATDVFAGTLAADDDITISFGAVEGFLKVVGGVWGDTSQIQDLVIWTNVYLDDFEQEPPAGTGGKTWSFTDSAAMRITGVTGLDHSPDILPKHGSYMWNVYATVTIPASTEKYAIISLGSSARTYGTYRARIYARGYSPTEYPAYGGFYMYNTSSNYTQIVANSGNYDPCTGTISISNTSTFQIRLVCFTPSFGGTPTTYIWDALHVEWCPTAPDSYVRLDDTLYMGTSSTYSTMSTYSTQRTVNSTTWGSSKLFTENFNGTDLWIPSFKVDRLMKLSFYFTPFDYTTAAPISGPASDTPWAYA